MFDRATELMYSEKIDRCVCLMDIADDWNMQRLVNIYGMAYDRAIRFAKEFPDTLWCWGNHDISYAWLMKEAGYSVFAEKIVREKIDELISVLPQKRQLAFVHRIDNVIFVHGGITESFVKIHLDDLDLYDDVDIVISWINSMGPSYMWTECSPLWYRPIYNYERMYMQDEFLQVVGHTPVRKIRLDKERSILSCDNFSDRFKDPAGSELPEFLILDTKTWDFYGKA